MIQALEQQLIHLMVRCLTDGLPSRMTVGNQRHDTIVAKFEEYLEANPNTPLYLPEICAAIGAAERTLRVACEQHLGMGPIRYLVFAENASCPPCAVTGGSIDDNGNENCHRSRVLGIGTFLGQLSRLVWGNPFGDIATTVG